MSTEIAVYNGAQAVQVADQYPQEKVDLIKRTICKGATDDELQLFVHQCRRTGLDPFSRQIHAVKRWDSQQGREVMAIQTGIDGFRLIAERTGKYEGQTAPQWCGEDGVWHDVWLSKQPPAAARIGIHKTGCREPFWGVARWASFVQTKKDGTPTQFWQKMGPDMLAKCAESQAFRKGFPQELAGIYTNEEMTQADHGSREEQQSVAESKIEQLKRQVAELPAPPPEEPGSDIKRVMDGFTLIKQDLFAATGSNEAYYRVLGSNGFEHANQIISNGGVKKARAIYKEMAAALKDVREQVTEADVVSPG